MPALCLALALGPKDDDERGRGEEPDQEEPHGTGHGSRCDNDVENPTRRNEGHRDLLSFK